MSSVNDLTSLGITERDLNLLRNEHIKFDCGPLVYRSVIDWGFALPAGKRIIDHFNDLGIGEKNKAKFKGNLKKFVDRNEQKFQKCSFSDFDITSLHDFLPILCHDKIAQLYTTDYDEQMKDPNSVESLLKEIKEFRNEVSHEYAEAVKDNIGKMRDTMRKCITSAGKLYGKLDTEIDEKEKLLDDMFDQILFNTTHLYEIRVKYIAQKIKSEVPSNMLQRYSPYFSVPLPSSSKKIDTSGIFQCCNVSVTTENNESYTKDNTNVFPCTEIYNNKHENFVVIKGGPGSGKTTLMRNMCKDILETSVNGSTPRYENIEQFKIPIYLECRFEQETNLAKFLRDCLKDFFSHEDDIKEAFKIVKGLVFLIDGYDEINNNCRQLVDSIIPFCRDQNICCIVSSRVDAGNNFVNELKDRNLNCTKMFIEAISEMRDKVDFLRSYAGKMDGSIDTDKLVNSFVNLTAAAQEIFSSPILLALFISLFVQDPDSVTKMKNEQSVYEAVRTNFLREMERKLRNASYPIGRAEDIAFVLGKFCLKLFQARKYFMDNKEYSKMVFECKKIKDMPDTVDIHSLLSCILTPEYSFKYNQEKSYQFFHSTIQEFFAAMYISEKIRELKDDRTSQSQSEDRQLPKLLQILKLKESQRDIEREMERYGNIIKLLMLEILAEGELPEYNNTFTLLLKKYYKPKYELVGCSPVYHLDLILSSDSNADIISIVSDCLRCMESYFLKYSRHIKPMTAVLQTIKTRLEITYSSTEVTSTQQLIELLAVLGDDSEISLHMRHSYINYQPLEGEFYTQLQISKCKVKTFSACISSEEHLSIVVKSYRGKRNDNMDISTPSVFSFAALEEYKGDSLFLTVKYSEDFSISGNNPVKWGTILRMEHIPVDGRDNLYNLLKYLSPKSKEFGWIELEYCHLTETHANELLKKLHEEKIRTVGWGDKTKVEEMRVHEDQSRWLKLHLKESENERRKKERREEERKKNERREKKRREKERREYERSMEKMREKPKCFIS